MHRAAAGVGLLIGVMILVVGASAVDITDCGEITAPGHYVMKNDIEGTGNCITITASDVILDGMGSTITGSTLFNGVYAHHAGSITVRNLTVRKEHWGIQYKSVDGGLIEKVTATDNFFGIWVTGSTAIHLKENTVSTNTFGIDIVMCNDCVALGNTVSENKGGGITSAGERNNLSWNTVTKNCDGQWPLGGIVILGSKDTVVLENTASENKESGIVLSGSSGTTVLSNRMYKNEQSGIFLLNAEKNSVTSNDIQENRRQGIWLDSKSENTIYNNFFFNTKNAQIGANAGSNTWNIPKTPGSNIVRGPYLGGNYWGQPDGKGFSQTCTDASPVDGICDKEYPLAKDNTDLLPLTNLTGKTGQLTPDADTSVNAGAGYDQVYGKRVPVRDLNFGGSSGIVVQRGQRCMPGFSFWEAALIRFNLSHIAPGVGIRKATLNLTQSTLMPEPVGVHRVLLPWTEREATFNRPCTACTPWSGGWDGGVNFVAAPTDTIYVTGEVGRSYTWDVTADVQTFVDGLPNHGWMLRSAETRGQSDYSRTAFYSRESTVGGVFRGPVLEIEFGTNGGGGDFG